MTIVFFSQSNPSKYSGITREAFTIVFKAQISSKEKRRQRRRLATLLGSYIIPSHIIFPVIQLFPFTEELTEATRALVADSEAHSFHLRTLPTHIYTEYYFLFCKKDP